MVARPSLDRVMGPHLSTPAFYTRPSETQLFQILTATTPQIRNNHLPPRFLEFRRSLVSRHSLVCFKEINSSAARENADTVERAGQAALTLLWLFGRMKTK